MSNFCHAHLVEGCSSRESSAKTSCAGPLGYYSARAARHASGAVLWTSDPSSDALPRDRWHHPQTWPAPANRPPKTRRRRRRRPQTWPAKVGAAVFLSSPSGPSSWAAGSLPAAADISGARPFPRRPALRRSIERAAARVLWLPWCARPSSLSDLPNPAPHSSAFASSRPAHADSRRSRRSRRSTALPPRCSLGTCSRSSRTQSSKARRQRIFCARAPLGSWRPAASTPRQGSSRAEMAGWREVAGLTR